MEYFVHFAAQCDYGYTTRGSLSDGRSCFKVEDGQTPADGDICAKGLSSDLIRPVIPTKTEMIEELIMRE